MRHDLDQMTYTDALAALSWQVDLGVSDAIEEAPINRFDLEPEVKPAPVSPEVAQSKPAPIPAPKAATVSDLAKAADALAQAAPSLDALRAAMADFHGLDLRKGARNMVFSQGNPQADVMVIAEAPSRADDEAGQGFSDEAGKLFDAMFGAIGLSRSAEGQSEALYFTYVSPWRMPQDRPITEAEHQVLRPFLLRHIALCAPKAVVLLGNASCVSALSQTGVQRLRESDHMLVAGAHRCSAFPIYSPARLINVPLLKREAWADLLKLKASLGGAR